MTEEKRTKVVMIDGGCGRVLCAVPAIEKLAEINDVVVISSWLEPFINNSKIKRLYHISHPYLWEDVISKGELLHPEPYFDYKYYTQQHHLINSFNKLLNNTETFVKPNIYLMEDEEIFAENLLKNIKEQFGDKKIIVFQPFGAGAQLIGDCNTSYNHTQCKRSKILDKSNRSLSMDAASFIATELSSNYIILYLGNLPFDCKKAILPNPPLNLRQWMAVIKQADYFLGIDSMGQHIAYSFNKPGTVILGTTYKENVTYPEHFKLYQKSNYPRSYDPIRLPAMNFTNLSNEQNKDAMNFSNNELREIIEITKKELGN